MIPAEHRPVAVKALSFGLVGVVNSVVDFGVFALAYYYLGTSIIVAQVVAWRVRPVVLELERAAGAGAYPFADASAERGAWHRQAHARSSSNRAPVNR